MFGLVPEAYLLKTKMFSSILFSLVTDDARALPKPAVVRKLLVRVTVPTGFVAHPVSAHPAGPLMPLAPESVTEWRSVTRAGSPPLSVRDSC